MSVIVSCLPSSRLSPVIDLSPAKLQMFRSVFITAALVAHAASAFLGHAGLHAVLGETHGHCESLSTVESKPSADSHGCHHHHGEVAHHEHLTPEESQQHDDAPIPHRHDSEDCQVCQFTEQAQSPLAFFELPSAAELVVDAATASAELTIPVDCSAYDSRGPPLV